MGTRSKITGHAIASFAIYMMNAGIDFEFNSEKRELRTQYSADKLKTLLNIWEFDEDMVKVEAVEFLENCINR